MLAILAVTAPFFALILTGYLAARSGLLPLEAVPGLNVFVLFFALPCMLFRFGARLPVGELLNPGVLAVYGACALVVVALTLALTHARAGWRDGAFGALVAAFPNTGFMGVPLLVALLGPAAAGPVINTLLVDLFVTSALCLAIAQAPHPRDAAGHPATAGTDPRESLKRSLRAALGNPQPWAIAAGGVVSALSLTLPAPLERVVAMLGDAASPVALFTIGAVLWRTGGAVRRAAAAAASASGVTAPAALPSAPIGPVVAIKLLLHPALMWAATTAAQAAGVPLTGFQALVLVLAAALPSASNVSLLAERDGADTGRVARIILWTTVLAFGSFSLIAWAFGVQGK
jgi:malonate transporter and related proteins